MAERTPRSRVTWGMTLLDFAFVGSISSTVGVLGEVLQGAGVDALIPIPFTVVSVGSFVFAANRLGARPAEYLRHWLLKPLQLQGETAPGRRVAVSRRRG